MKKIISIFIFLILIINVYAEVYKDIFYFDEIDLDIELKSSVFLVPKSDDHETEYVSINLKFLPTTDSRQNVISIETNPKADIDENVNFWIDNPDIGEIEYSLTSNIKTHNRFNRIKKHVDFPIKNLDSNLQEYIMPTNKIDINKNIINLASTLAEGENNLFKVVFNIADWTQENIEYSLDTLTAEASQKSSWVLENRYGVCDEITNLFIALSRSLGIPARFISGISYTNSEQFANPWGLHGWAEVYFPDVGWVPFDVTYGQLGYIDAGHIKLKESLDSDKTSTKFEWRGNNVDLTTESLEVDVTINGKGKKIISPIDINVISNSPSVDFGSYNLIIADIKNIRDYYVTTELHLSTSKEIELIDSNKKHVYLKPKEKKRFFWIIKIPDSLKKDFIYTFPIGITSSFDESYSTSFEAKRNEVKYSLADVESIVSLEKEADKKVYSRNIELMCLNINDAITGKKIIIECDLKNLGNVVLHDLKICLENDCEERDLHISESKKIEFTKIYDETGEKAVTITAKNTGVTASSFFKIFVVDEPVIDIIDMVYPESIKYKEKFDVEFTLIPMSLTEPKNVILTFTFNDESQQWKFDSLETKKPVKIEIDSALLKEGETEFKIYTTYTDGVDKKFNKDDSFTISMDDLTGLQKIEKFFVDLFRKIRNLF